MPPRVTYWTGVWDPDREALSKEVEALRRTLAPGAPVVSFSAGNRRSAWRRAGVWKLSSRQWPALRLLACWLERRGDVTHVFGAMDSWHFLRALGRRPLVLTVAVPGAPLAPALYRNVSCFAAESESLVDALSRAGVPRDRIRLIYPGVDLHRFRPLPMPPIRPFRVVFASVPADPAELDSRGVRLLVDVARAEPDVEIVIPWRTWGDNPAARRAVESLAPPANVRIELHDAADMAAVYASAHAVAALFDAGAGKACPNSIAEGLAAGRPAIVSDACGIAGVVERTRAGVVCRREPGAVLDAIGTLSRDIEGYRQRARAVAEKLFSLSSFRQAYERVYQTVSREAQRGQPADRFRRAASCPAPAGKHARQPGVRAS